MGLFVNSDGLTWELPRVVPIKVYLGDDWDGDRLSCTFSAEIVVDELLVCWMESETRWQLQFSATHDPSCLRVELLRQVIQCWEQVAAVAVRTGSRSR